MTTMMTMTANTKTTLIRAGKFNIICRLFRPCARNTLCGFAAIEIAEVGLTIYDVAIHQKGSAHWAQLPAKAQVRDGSLVKDADGKIQYVKMLDFSSRTARDAFSAAVIAAVREGATNAFAEVS
jgi:hypothetical protein